MLGFLGRILRWVLILIAVIVAIPVLGLAYGWLTTDQPAARSEAIEAPPPALAAEIRAEIPGYQRPEESTFLTYPEWAIVYAAREYAAVVEEHPPYAFAYWGSIGRFWQDYATVIRATAEYPFNFNNHVMLVVIGVSHTIEHAAQWAYENTFGRLTALWFPVEEDRFQADAAAEYAAFLDTVPWYRFDYAGKRAGLWDAPSAPGLGVIRSWERKLAFGLSYSIKRGYADLINSGLQATFDPAALELYVWAQGPVADATAGVADTRVVKDMADEGVIFVTPRYQPFTELVPMLVERGVSFVEIAGNDEILVTVLSRGRLTPFEGTRAIFSGPLPSDARTTRTGLIVPVPLLHEVLPALQSAGARLEHIYDY